jgi:uncharacterized UBP type Zn finger protein
VVQHCGGSAQFGHYVAATRDALSGRWTHHDDQAVSRVRALAPTRAAGCTRPRDGAAAAAVVERGG